MMHLLKIGIVVFLTGCACGEPAIKVIEAADSTTATLRNTTLWTYHHDSTVGKPYFHPLSFPDGTCITDLRPGDHPWHRGLWFSWKTINGVNFWEENRETGQSDGKTQLLETRREISERGETHIFQELAYALASDEAPVMKESRRIIVSAPRSSGGYTIEWSTEFLALRDLVLDRTPIPGEAGGRRHGGYAGLSLRMSKTLQGSFSSGQGLSRQDLHGTAAPWVLFQSEVGGSVCFMDHPENFDHPARWYVDRSMPFLSPSPLFAAPRALETGQTLRLRYKIVISPERLNAEDANKGFARWTGR